MSTSTYIVAATPRSGSTLLCDGLRATGIAGRPAEVFAPLGRQAWRSFWGLPPDSPFGEFVRAALDFGTSANGVYGMKIHWEHVPQLADSLAVSRDPGLVLRALFPRAAYVNIVRHDLRAQALSLFRALATGEWLRPHGVPASTPLPELDLAEVLRLERLIAAQQESWLRFFRTYGVEPLIVEYEELAADFTGQVGRVLAFLGLDAGTISGPRLARQADEVSLRWRREMEREG